VARVVVAPAPVPAAVAAAVAAAAAASVPVSHRRPPPTLSSSLVRMPTLPLGQLRRLAQQYYPYTTALRLSKHVTLTADWKVRTPSAHLHRPNNAADTPCVSVCVCRGRGRGGAPGHSKRGRSDGRLLSWRALTSCGGRACGRCASCAALCRRHASRHTTTICSKRWCASFILEPRPCLLVHPWTICAHGAGSLMYAAALWGGAAVGMAERGFSAGAALEDGRRGAARCCRPALSCGARQERVVHPRTSFFSPLLALSLSPSTTVVSSNGRAPTLILVGPRRRGGVHGARTTGR
jgi:hypothetical protein